MPQGTVWTRASQIGALESEASYDTLVVGGGIIGAGVALDLSARGFKVALVEQHDFASGTSGRSTKLFHGGIRYLPQLEFHLVAEGLREQKVLAHIADYLFEPLEFVIPLYQQYGIADAPAWASKGRRAVAALKAGLLLYDVLGGRGRPGRSHRHLRAEQVLEIAPSLRRDGLRSGYVYSDAQTDDARLVIAVMRTAVERYGAVAVNRVRASQLQSDGETYRVQLIDVEDGAILSVKARSVVAATGAFPAPALANSHPLDLIASKGAHLIVDREVLRLGDHAIVLPETEDERVLFIIPWQRHALIGTTDTAFHENLANPTASPADIDYLVRHVTRFLEVEPFEPLSTFAGLRALADPGADNTAQASRDHVIAQPSPGYVQVAGGKLTTYRRISAEAADHIARHLGHRSHSPTAAIPLVGAGADLRQARQDLIQTGVSGAIADVLLGRYGGEARLIAELIEARPSLGSPLSDGHTLQAEVVHAVRHESCSTLADFTLRRTRLAWLTADHGRKDQELIASVMGAELGWGGAEMATQLEAHERELTAEAL